MGKGTHGNMRLSPMRAVLVRGAVGLQRVKKAQSLRLSAPFHRSCDKGRKGWNINLKKCFGYCFAGCFFFEISSAMMLMAISSGVSAWMARPMGQ